MNNEYYPDPTADLALNRLIREEKQKLREQQHTKVKESLRQNKHHTRVWRCDDFEKGDVENGNLH